MVFISITIYWFRLKKEFLVKKVYLNKMNLTINADCQKLKLLGYYLSFTCLTGFLLNSILIWIFSYSRELRTPLNRLIMTITVNNLVGCLIDMPLQIISTFKCAYVTFLFISFFVYLSPPLYSYCWESGAVLNG